MNILTGNVKLHEQEKEKQPNDQNRKRRNGLQRS